MKITDEENMNTIKHMEYIKEASRKGYGLKSHGFIYEVQQGFRAINHHSIYIKDGEILKEKYEEADKRVHEVDYIKKGEYIEFRFEYDFHFRTEDNKYYVVDPSIIALKCIPFARIDEKTKCENKLNLKEILDKKLYEIMS